MKAQDFLKLVELMMTAQQDYFAARRKNLGVITTQNLLIKSKGLEKQVWEVVKGGVLEPDVVTTVEVAQQLDFTANQRPTDGQGEQPT